MSESTQIVRNMLPGDTQELRNLLKRAARSLLLAYALLYLMTMWTAESVYASRIAFQRDCNAWGGFITLRDGLPTCTRLRSGGMMQL